MQSSSWSTFDDSVNNGGSRTLKLTVSDSGLEWIFTLDRGAMWPYIGVSSQLQIPESNGSKWQSFDADDSLVMEISSNREGPVLVQLSSFDPKITKLDNPISFRVLESGVTVTEKVRRIAIPLHQFRVANWWKTQFKVPPEDHELFLDSVCTVEWVFNDSTRFGQVDTFRIHSFQLKKNTKKILSFYLAVFSLTVALSVVWLLKRKKDNSKTQSGSTSIKLNPKPILVGPSDWDRVLTYLQTNYLDPDLTIHRAAKTLAISESKLSRLIREHHHEGFRSLIHDLRTKEAKRLLLETTMNVSEIAFKLGYATPSHFNREFKQREGVTPTVFRKS